MGSLCSKGSGDDDYDSDDSDFEADDLLVGDEDIDPELIANSSMPESFMELDEDGTGLIENPEFLKGFGVDDTPLVSSIYYCTPVGFLAVIIGSDLSATGLLRRHACPRCRRCFSSSTKTDLAVSISSSSSK